MYGTRFFNNYLLVQIKDTEGTFWGYQKIFEDGKKLFLTGQKKKGCFYSVGQDTTERIYICEGFATAVTIHKATDCYTVAAWDCGNLVSVAKEIRRKYKQAKIIICADDDRKNPSQM